MALINHAKREINAKIVYYGREGVGKRASLQYLYDRIKPSLRGELKVAPASGDSLLFFDFSPFEQPQFGGYRVRFHMYSLTGTVTNPAAWKMTLKGTDGLVIVADATPDSGAATRTCISNLRGFLSAYGVGLHDIPCALQLNKGGGSERPPGAEIATGLDLTGIRSCFSDSGSGEGVLEALSLVSRDIMARIGQDETLREGGRLLSPSMVTDGDQSPALAHPGVEKESMKPKPAATVAEGASPAAENQPDSGHDREPLQVSLAGEGAGFRDGAVRIPLEITLGGESRRLIVSIAIEQP